MGQDQNRTFPFIMLKKNKRLIFILNTTLVHNEYKIATELKL